MEIPVAPAWQLYISLSRKRSTHTHMNTQTLSLSGEEEEFIWTLSKQISFFLAHTLQLPGMDKLNGQKAQKSSQIRQFGKACYERQNLQTGNVQYWCICAVASCGMWWWHERKVSSNEAMLNPQ